MVDEEPVHFRTLDRTYQYILVVYPQADDFREFPVLVDPDTGKVESDLAGMRAAEQAAYQAKYGKLTPLLYDRLQTAADDDRLPVAIWVTYTEHGRQPEELVAEVAQTYPEAAIALQEHGAPWAVGNPDLAQAIQGAYMERLRASLSAWVDPLLAWLARQGYQATQFIDMPVMALTLTKSEIDKVAQHPLVERIYLTETAGASASDIATATDRMPTVWQQNISGNGMRIAIVEGYDGGTNINATARNCLNIAATYNASFYDRDHISQVAAIAACRDDSRPGAAKGSVILDGGFDDANNPTDAFADALTWAVGQNPSTDIVNVSWSTWLVANPGSTDLLLADRIADYWVRYLWKTIVVVAGNSTRPHGTTVSSPGKGWNVLTVGNLDDRNNAHWSNDIMNSTSSYVDPSTDIEKPEVAAPGTNINTVAGQSTGTSFAAPQVSGLAALMMEAHSDLKTWPAAVKAIVMASAFHNIENNDNSEGGNVFIGDKDGAGAIDAAAAVADNKAISNECRQPCWWAVDPPEPNQSADYYLYAVQGERVRVVTTWLSNVGGSQWDPTDTLASNYNLYIYRPGDDVNTFIASASGDNNVEMVEFIAPESGRYRVKISHVYPDTDFGNRPAIAWSKQATYLPDVRNSAGWNAEITIRNDGAVPRSVRITYLRPDGSQAGISDFVGELSPNAVWTPPMPSNFQGHAVIDGSEDLSAVVIQRLNSPYAIDSYTGVSAPSTAAHVPIVQRDNSGWRSHLFIQNASGSPANVIVRFYPPKQAECRLDYTVPGGGSVKVDVYGVNCINANYGSAYIVSDQPIAVASSQYTTNGASFLEADNRQATSNPIYAPLIQNGNSNWIAGLNIQNATANSGYLNATFRRNDGTNPCSLWSSSMAAYHAWTVFPPCNPGSTIASAELNNTAGPVAANINQIKSDSSAPATTYPAIATSYSHTVILPRVRYDGGWEDAFTVHNLSNQSNLVTIRAYNANGGLLSTTTVNLGSRALAAQFAPGGTYSVVLTAQHPIVAEANNWLPSQNGDNIGSYAGVHR